MNQPNIDAMRSRPQPVYGSARAWLAVVTMAVVMSAIGCRRSAGPGDGTDLVVQGMNRGVSCMGQYDYEKAVQAFESVLQAKPDLADAQVNLAIALFNRGRKEDRDLDRAGQLLSAVLQRSPSHLRALYFQGVLLQFSGQTEASVPCFERVLQLRPADGATWYLLGLSKERIGQPAEAEYLKAIQFKPYLSSAYYKLSQLALRAGDAVKAGPYLEHFKRLRESPLNEIIELPQYGQMGDLALVQPFEPRLSPPLTPSRSSADADRILFETDRRCFAPVQPGEPLSGAALADINQDGVPDLLVPAPAAGEGGGVLLLVSAGSSSYREEAVVRGLGSGRAVTSGAWGDLDNDGVPDLLLAGAGRHAFRGLTNGAFSEITAAIAPATNAGAARSALFWDADHDGDLDLLWSGLAGAGQGLHLLNNNADGTFTTLTPTNGLAVKGDIVAVLPGDVDGDRDVDLVVLERGRSARIFLNDLLGQYHETEQNDAALRGDLGGVLQDLNGDGLLDLLTLGGDPPALRLFLGDGHGRFRLSESPLTDAAAVASWGAPRGIRVADVDLDGDLDIAIFGRDGHLLLNDGKGRFVFLPQVWKAAPGYDWVGAEWTDLTGDRVPDLLVMEQGATSRVRLCRGVLTPPGTAVAFQPTGLRGVDQRTRSPASGYGASLKVRTGLREQTLLYNGLNGGPNQSWLPLVFGLGGAAQVDYVSLAWPDGVMQVEVALGSGPVHAVPETQRKISSCPVLFAWNGERFEFITDFAGVGGLGYFSAPGVSAPPQVLEHVKIEPGQLVAKEGVFELRITEPMEETAYVDRLELVAVDHPADWAVYPDERLAVNGPPPTHELLVARERIWPLHATTADGRDCTDRLMKVDRLYAYDPPLDRRFVGFCRPHTLELDFGSQGNRFGATDKIHLFIQGFIEYPYSQTVYAAGQAGLAWEPIRVEGQQPGGQWQTVVPDGGAPGGLGRMMTLELTGKLSRGTGRIRLTTNLEIYYDAIFLARQETTEGLVRRSVPLREATLRRVGFPREYSPDGRRPLIYDYQNMDPTAPFHVLRGAYTRFGAVGSLLAEFDDQYVLVGPGEEIAARFDATVLEPLRPGLARSFLLISHAYCKDLDLYTAECRTVEPWPFRTMSRYPYPSSEAYPESAAHRKYRAEYNTRLVE